MSPVPVSQKSIKDCLAPSFSHIYLEEEAAELPGARRVLERFPRARVVPVGAYSEVFNRSNQEWRLQKRSLKLVLARRREDFLYRCSDIAPSFGNPEFYYNTLMMNCLYDCDYCYLQGMYPSANVVMFLNTEDYFQATAEQVRQAPLYLCLSYDTDLLAFEAVYPYVREWVSFARSQPDLLTEVRTKSANYRLIRDLTPASNVILAWTLSPDAVSRRFEPRTPPLSARLASLQAALEDGWPVRLCFDPLLRVPGWEEVYGAFLDQVAAAVDLESVRDASVGVFRMNRDYLKRIRRQRADSAVIHHPYEVEERIASYPEPQRREMLEFVTGRLHRWMPREKVFVV